MLLISFFTNYMELPREFLEEIAFKTRLKLKKH